MARRLPMKANLSMGGASRGASANKSTRIPKAKAKAKTQVKMSKVELRAAKARRAEHQKGDTPYASDTTKSTRTTGKTLKRLKQEVRKIDSKARSPKATELDKRHAGSMKDTVTRTAEIVGRRGNRGAKAKAEMAQTAAGRADQRALKSKTEHRVLQGSGRRVIDAKKAVRGAQSRVSGVKARGSKGRRTFFLDGDS